MTVPIQLTNKKLRAVRFAIGYGMGNTKVLEQFYYTLLQLEPSLYFKLNNSVGNKEGAD